MGATIEIKDSVYAELLAKSLPRPIHSGAEHARLTEMLLRLDERGDLSPEEEALAEVLTLLIEDYEDKAHPLPRVSPHKSLNALMEERGFEARGRLCQSQWKLVPSGAQESAPRHGFEPRT